MKAIILAGGKGTRLGDLTKEIPKPMVLIDEKPLLLHQVELLKKYGINDILIIVNYLKDSIVNFFQDGKKLGVNITYYLEKEPLGTAGALKEIKNEIAEDFLLLYGDVMINMNLDRFINFHYSKQSDCTLVLHPNDHPYDSDLVEVNKDSRISAFHSKPHNKDKFYRNLVNAGLYLMNRKIFNYYKPGKKDFGKDIFPSIFSKISMFGYNTSEYLKDMGTPERLEKVNKDYTTGKIERSSYEYEQKAIFLDRDGVLNDDKNLIHKVEDFDLYPFTSEAIKTINKSDYLAVVVTNQSVVARNLCTEAGLDDIHKKMDTLLGNQGSWVDALYYCPHHPDKGYPEENPEYKIDCDCRKPKPGMLLKASKDLNISLNHSFLIGDSETDILCAQNAGVTSVGVRTGKGLKNSSIVPDLFFDNLKEAIDFIVQDPLKSTYNEVLNIFERKSKKGPLIVAIAGNTRSGKSTLASYLTIKFKKKGIPVLKIGLDHWLLPSKADRDKAQNVFERYQVENMNSDLENLFKGNTITPPGYHHHPGAKKENVKYTITDERIIIIEGVVALNLPVIQEQADIKIFKQVSNEHLKNKMFNLYRWKGYDEKNIEEIFNKRLTDEYSIIEKSIQYANIIV